MLITLVVIGFHKWRSVFRLNTIERWRDGGIVSHQCEIVQLSSSASEFIVIICICVRTQILVGHSLSDEPIVVWRVS